MSSPAGRENWAWEWMGFSPPIIYDELKDPSFEPYRKCMGEYFGIGDFSYWDKDEIAKLSNNEKLRLLKLLILYCEMPEDRKYLGLTDDGKINTQINEYANGRKEFYSTLTVEDCRKRRYAHSERCRTTEGFYCDSCETFFGTDSEDWIKEERLGFGLWNLRVSFYRLKLDVPDEIQKLFDEQQEIEKKPFADKDINRILEVHAETVALWEKYKDIREKADIR